MSSNNSPSDQYLERAMKFMNVKNYKKAIADLNKSLKGNPLNIDTYILMGICFTSMDKFKLMRFIF